MSCCRKYVKYKIFTTLRLGNTGKEYRDTGKEYQNIGKKCHQMKVKEDPAHNY